MSDCTSPFDAQLQRRLVELTEAGLPLIDDPWAWLAGELGLEVDATLALLQRLQAAGAIRRMYPHRKLPTFECGKTCSGPVGKKSDSGFCRTVD